MQNAEGWKRVATRLIEARVAAGFLRRSDFARHHQLGNARTLFDIEKAKRDNYSAPMIVMLEQIYGLPAGEIRRLLAGEASEDGPAAAVDDPITQAEDDIRRMRGVSDTEKDMLIAVLRAKRAERGIGVDDRRGAASTTSFRDLGRGQSHR